MILAGKILHTSSKFAQIPKTSEPVLCLNRYRIQYSVPIFGKKYFHYNICTKSIPIPPIRRTGPVAVFENTALNIQIICKRNAVNAYMSTTQWITRYCVHKLFSTLLHNQHHNRNGIPKINVVVSENIRKKIEITAIMIINECIELFQ